jgi:hypothetical protein
MTHNDFGGLRLLTNRSQQGTRQKFVKGIIQKGAYETDPMSQTMKPPKLNFDDVKINLEDSTIAKGEFSA